MSSNDKDSAKKLSLLREYVAIAEEIRPNSSLPDRFHRYRYQLMLAREERYNELLERLYYGIFESNGAFSPLERLFVASLLLWTAYVSVIDTVIWSLLNAIVIIFDAIFRKAKPTKRVSSAPGYLMLAVTSFFYSPRTNERVFQQLVNDMRDEYFSALHEFRPWKARWIRLRYAIAFVETIALSSGIKLLDNVITIWKVFH